MSPGLRIESLAPGAERGAEVNALAPSADPALRSAPPPAAAELRVAWRAERPVARLSLAVVSNLHGAPGSSGLVGHYEALEAEAGTALLGRAARELLARRVARVLGPMDGDTWHRYRLALRSRPEDPHPSPAFFPGEPFNPFEYVEHFTAAGYAPVADYETRVTRPVASPRPADPFPPRLAERGLRLRNLDLTRFEAELEALHALSLLAFARNPYYTPIGVEEFLALYRPFATRVDPRFVLMVEREDRALAGFLFAYPLPAAAERPASLVIKTIATHPDLQGVGLMGYLFDRVHADAWQAGFGAVFHALMERSNFSERLSQRHGGVLYRRYALFGLEP